VDPAVVQFCYKANHAFLAMEVDSSKFASAISPVKFLKSKHVFDVVKLGVRVKVSVRAGVSE